jgi:hypothetical protein
MSTRGELLTMPLEGDLRDFLVDLSARVSAEGLDVVGEDGLEGEGVSVDRTDDARLSFTWRHDDWLWTFRLDEAGLAAVADGTLTEVEMRRTASLVIAADGGIDRLLSALFNGGGGGGGEAEADDEDAAELDDDVDAQPAIDPSALAFLNLLLEHELIELTETGDKGRVANGMAIFLEPGDSARRRAEALTDWLLEQDDVEDVFADDETLIKLLKRW